MEWGSFDDSSQLWLVVLLCLCPGDHKHITVEASPDCILTACLRCWLTQEDAKAIVGLHAGPFTACRHCPVAVCPRALFSHGFSICSAATGAATFRLSLRHDRNHIRHVPLRLLPADERRTVRQ